MGCLFNKAGRKELMDVMNVEAGMRGIGRPTAEQTRLLTDRILDVAKSQFLARGYNGTTFGSIADEVPTSRGALYNRFSDKSALFSQVVKAQIDEMCTRTALSMEHQGSIRESLFRQAMQIVSVSMEPQHTALYAIIIKDAPRTQMIDDALRQAWAFYVSHIQDYFELTKSKGTILIKNRRKTANMFLGLVFQPVHTAIVYGYPMPGPDDLAEHIHASVLMFLGGIGRMELEG